MPLEKRKVQDMCEKAWRVKQTKPWYRSNFFFSILSKSHVVSGEYNMLEKEMPLFPPQGFSHTSHPEDQTPPAHGSHILMNTGGKEM